MACRPVPLKPPCEYDAITYDIKTLESSLQFQNLWTPDLADVLAGKKANPESVKREVKIAIVGGGPAGLMAAYELQKIPDAKITVFEQADRIGGRIMTVGYHGHLEKDARGRDFWTEKITYGEAGGMRLPLPPQNYMKAKYFDKKDVNLEISKFTNAEINQLLHGKAPYEFVVDEDFPMPIIRHYIKEMEIPVKRFNMSVAAATIDVDFDGKKFEGYYVRGDDGHLYDENKKTLEENFKTFLEQNTTGDVLQWIKDVGDLSAYLDFSITNRVQADLRQLTPEKWDDYLSDWNLTYRKCLTEAKNNKGSLDFKKWPESIIDFYQDVYRMGMDDVISSAVIETDLGHWWQDTGMYCPVYGMHSIYEKPPTIGNDETSSKDLPAKALGFKDRFNSKVNIHCNGRVTGVKRDSTNGKIDVTVMERPLVSSLFFGTEEVHEFDAVMLTVPPHCMKDIKVTGFPNLPDVATIDLPYMKLSKNMYEFTSMFWREKDGASHNRGDFKMNGYNGFLTASKSSEKGFLSQLRYSTPDEGNVIMNYEFAENAEVASKHDDDTILNFVQKFHTGISVKNEAVIKSANSCTVGKFRAPWMNLSGMPYTADHVATMKKFCNYGDVQGLYFAGDAWSFKPQWQEGSFYTALHAVFRLINNFSGKNDPDPFQY